MREDPLRYDRMVEQALRGVVRQALRVVAERGLPGGHHFYITFLTHHPGVQISDTLIARFPKDMTIVLQYEFWGLEVEEQSFAVTLSFSGQHERLFVPFAAVTGFADPAVKFGLQFEVAEGDVAEGGGPLVVKAPERKTAPLGETTPETGGEAAKTADVVTLDTFRKK